MPKKKQITYSLTGLLILLIPNIACMVLSTDLTYSWLKEVAYIGVVLLCYALPMPFVKQRTYFILTGIVGLFWMPIEVSSLYLNKMTTSKHFIGIILETNWIEASEVLKSAWPLVILTLCLWGGYWWLVSRINNEQICPKWTRIPAGIAAILIAGLSISVYTVGTKFEKIYPINIYLEAYELHQENASIRQIQAQIADFRFGLDTKQDSVEEHYIFILGEAARYDHFHLNGYARHTSPELDTIAGLYSMERLYTQANLTLKARPLILTRATIDDPERGVSERGIAEAYHEAGFQTAWLSNQPLVDYSRRMANEQDYRYGSITGLEGGTVHYDTIVVGLAQRLFEQHKTRKSFYLLHLLGSHLKYDQRYPKEYERFTPAVQASDGYAVLSAKNKDKVVNAYDNTILYTDHVIAEAIRLLQKQKGIRALIYVSDHGENLFDDEREMSVHGSYEGTVYEAHVPCFIWLSEEFRQAYPEKVAALEANQKQQVQSDVLFHSLADMGGLDKIVEAEKSIFSPQLKKADIIRMTTGNGEIKQLRIMN